MRRRGLDDNILRELKARAKRKGISLDSLALRLLKEGIFLKKNGGRRASRSGRPFRDREPGGGIWTERCALSRNRAGSPEGALAPGPYRYQ